MPHSIHPWCERCIQRRNSVSESKVANSRQTKVPVRHLRQRSALDQSVCPQFDAGKRCAGWFVPTNLTTLPGTIEFAMSSPLVQLLPCGSGLTMR